MKRGCTQARAPMSHHGDGCLSPDEGMTRSALLAKKDEAFSVIPAFAPALPKKPAPSLL
jgi:hypothetical protein